jgi:hypothetical protein
MTLDASAAAMAGLDSANMTRPVAVVMDADFDIRARRIGGS